MSRLTTIAVALASTIALGSTVAVASERCTSSPRSEWRSPDDVKVAAEALGYKDIRKVKIEDSCFEAYAFDKDGRRVEIYFNPVTLKVVRVKDKS